MLEDIGHPFAKGKKVYDITFENVQAGERTSHLFRLANFHDGMVVGTGDLSELALGWATYGVGDHMSHYNVNASVPKTLIQFLVGWVARIRRVQRRREARAETRAGDRDLARAGARRARSSEASVGPYELQDFNLYYTAALRLRADEGGVPRLARVARQVHSCAEIRKWLGVFLQRFFR